MSITDTLRVYKLTKPDGFTFDSTTAFPYKSNQESWPL